MRDPTWITDEDYQFLLEKQQTKYQEIQERASRTIQFVFSVVSLVVSLGVLQTFANGVIKLSWDIPDKMVNQCSPDALTFSNVSLHGLGATSWIIGLGVLALSFYILLEMWDLNSRIQNLPPLRPIHPGDFLIGSYEEWLQDNQTKISKANKMRSRLIYKLYYFVGLVSFTTVLLFHLKSQSLFSVLYLDILYLVGGTVLVAAWAVRALRHSIGQSIVNHPFIYSPSRLFQVAFTLLWIFSLWQFYEMYLLVQYLLIC